MVIGGSGPGGTGWMLASQAHVTVAGGFAPVTEQFHRLPPWATLTTWRPAGRTSVTVVKPAHGVSPRLVTLIVSVAGCPLIGGLGCADLRMARSHPVAVRLPKLYGPGEEKVSGGPPLIVTVCVPGVDGNVWIHPACGASAIV